MGWLRRTLTSDQHREGRAVTRHTLRAYVTAVRAYLQAQAAAGTGAAVDHSAYFRLLLRKEPHAANEPRYFALDPEATIKSSLSGKTIIEFPTVHVVLASGGTGYSGYPLVPALVTELN